MFVGAFCGRPLAIVLLAAELALQAGGQGALGGQVLLQARDAQGRSRAVALVEQQSEEAGWGQLAAV
jgi:hypothetical protein